MAANDKQDINQVIPPGFIRLDEPSLPAIHRQLGYFGEARYVVFYYETRGEEVVWNDGTSFGFGSGGWDLFSSRVGPLAKQYDVNVGATGDDRTHVLLIDRRDGTAFFAEEIQAERFLARYRHARAA